MSDSQATANRDERYRYVVLMENFHYLHTAMQAVAHLDEIVQSMGIAQQCFAANMAAYANMILDRQFSSTAKLFYQIKASKVELDEVQYQAVFSKLAASKVLRSVEPSSMRKSIADIYKKVKRQITDKGTTATLGESASDMIAVAWAEIVEALCTRWKEYDRLCAACYANEPGMPLSVAQVRRLMVELVQVVPPAASSALAEPIE